MAIQSLPSAQPSVKTASAVKLAGRAYQYTAASLPSRAMATPLTQLGLPYFAAQQAAMAPAQAPASKKAAPVAPAKAPLVTSENIPLFNLEALKKRLLEVKESPEQRMAVGKEFLDAFHEYGAIRVDNHGVHPKTIADVFDGISQSLTKPLAELKKFVTREISQFRGLIARPNDPKRIFVMGHDKNVSLKGHEHLNETGGQLFGELTQVSKDVLEILSLIYEGKTDGVLTRMTFKDTLNTPTPVAKDATLRQIYYPSETELKRDGIDITDTMHGKKVRLRPHVDYGLITVLPASKEQGLYILPHRWGQGLQTEAAVRQVPLEKWVPLKTKPGELLVQIGRQLDIATRGMPKPISATWHGVLADDDQLQRSRSSLSFFVENKAEKLPDYGATLSAGQHITATHQYPGREPFMVDSLYRLMLEKWLSEGNSKALDDAGNPIPYENIIKRYENFADTVNQVVKNNPNIEHYKPTA